MANEAELGRNLGLSFTNESSYNEAWGSPVSLDGIYTNGEPDCSPALNHIREMHAHGLPMLTSNDIVTGIKNATLRTTGKLPKEGFGWLLASLMGKTTTAVDDSFYKHTFNPGLTHAPPSLKVQLRNHIESGNGSDTANSTNLMGVVVRSLEFSLEINRPIIWTAEMAVGNWDLATTEVSIVVPVPSSGNPFWFFNESGGVLTLGGTSGFISATIRLEQMLADGEEDSYQWGSDERVRLLRGASEDAFKAQVTLRRLIQSTDFAAAFEAFSDQAFVASVGSTPGYFWKVNFPKTKITDYRKVPRGLGLVQEEITAEAILTSDISEIYVEYEDKQANPATQGF